MNKTIAALALALAAVIATPVHAQPDGHASIGAGLRFNDFADKSFSSKNPSIAPEYHFSLHGSKKEGLGYGWRGGIGYSNVDRQDLIGGVPTHSGSLRMLPVMVGAGPTYRTGPLRVGMGVAVGPSFNKFTIDDAARAAYHDRLGATIASVDVHNSVAVRPDASLWYNLTSRVGVHTSVSYTFNRPVVETTVDGVTTSTRWKTDRLGYQAGFVFGVF